MPSTPQQVSAIKMNTFYSKNIPHIPFSESFDNAGGGSQTFYYVVLKIDDGSVTSFTEAQGSAHYKNLAVDNFIEHYAPGYYSFVAGSPTAIEFAAHNSDYTALRATLFDSLAVLNYREKLGQLPKVIYSTTYDLSVALGGPNDVTGIESFNTLRGAGNDADTTTTLDLTTFPMIQGEFNSFLSAFNTQVNNFPGQLNLNLNFNFLQTGVENILQVIIGELTKYMDIHSPGGYKPDDELRIEFNDENQIIMITYALGDQNFEATTGFITNIKYNNFFKDPLTLSTLKNYETIIETNRDNSQLTEQSSFLDFISNTFGEPGGDNPVNFNGPHTPDNAMGPWNNIFANRESEDLIDISDIDRINKIFSTFKTAEELQQIENYASDPQVRKMALQQEKAKRINAAIAVTDVVDKVLKFEFPLAGLNDTKAGRVINQIINQFGIQELAKEALICLTAGATISLSRISSAVKSELMTMSAAPLYTAPRNAPNVLERPELGDFASYFSITGDPPLYKQILDIILGALANAAFEIVKSIADMIKFNCDNLFDEDIGSMAAGEELVARMQPQAQFTEIPAIDGGITEDFWAPPPPEHMDYLQHLFLRIGFETVDAGFLYLNLVSGILNPSEICKLFNSPQDVSQETLDRILAYNQKYSESPAAMANLNTYSDISNFFHAAAAMVDTTSMCNDYLNSVADRLKKDGSCQVCFDEGAFADNAAINELVNIIENGIPMDDLVPPIDFMCPESEFFLDNPIISVTIPNLFYTLIETIQLYMGSSIEAARTGMLEPILTNQINTEQSGAFSAAGVEPPTGSFDPEVLETIVEIFSTVEGVLDDMNDPALCPDLDLSSMPAVGEILEYMDVIMGVFNAVAPELSGAMAEINDKVGSIQANSGAAATNSPFIQYVFNEEYKERFRYAIDPIDFRSTAMASPTAYEGYPYQFANPAALNERSYNIVRSQMGYNGTQAQSSFITFNFDLDVGEGAEAAIKFPSFDHSPAEGRIQILVSDDQMLYGDVGVTFNGVHDLTNLDYDDLTTELPMPSYDAHNINPFIARFTDALPATATQASGPTVDVNTAFVTTPLRNSAAGILFPQMFVQKLQKMFNYILNNGAFSEYKLSRLNFFKDNANCSAGNIGDLMDADGIIDQMQQELAAVACDKDKTIQEKIKAVVRYGIVNLLIQAYVVEFVVNNIIVFSAFNMVDIFADKYGFKSFMINGVTESLVSLINRVDPPAATFGASDRTLKGIIQRYLSTRIDRIAPVGIVSTDGLINFDTQEELEAAPLSSLVKFLVDERINHVWASGNRNTIKAINNIVDPTNSRPSLEDIYLRHIIEMYPKYSSQPVSVPFAALGNFEWFPGFTAGFTYGNLFFSRSLTYEDASSNDITVSAYHVHEDIQGPNTIFGGSNANFRPSYTLYYILPSLTAASLAPSLSGYASFDVTSPDTWIGFHTEQATSAFSGPTELDYFAQFYEFASAGATKTTLTTAFTGTPGTITTSEILQAKEIEIERIKSSSFKMILEQIASKDAMFVIANLYNFHLSRTYFPDVRHAFDNTKQAILNLLENVNASEAFPVAQPPSTVPALQASQATDGKSNMDSLMREIMLKVLRETPIAILKGLVELIDPHIAISKLIKDITGQAFNTAANVMDAATETATLPVPVGDAETLADLGITGQNILGLAFCGLNVLNQQASQALPSPPPAGIEDGPLLGPKFTMEGIDFKGTVAGMFMAPPSPLGILYLLFSMLENLDIPVDEEDAPPQLDMLEGPDSNSC